MVDDSLFDYYLPAISAALSSPPTAEWVPPNYDSVKVPPSTDRVVLLDEDRAQYSLLSSLGSSTSVSKE